MSKKVQVKITKDGPYMVTGTPKLDEQLTTANQEGNTWDYKVIKLLTSQENMALCRCGGTSNTPFCDGTHLKNGFDGKTTASFESIINRAEAIKGPNYTLYDNEDYCSFARFCDAYGRVWNLVSIGTDEADKMTIREATHCPAGRLLIQDNKTGKFLEPEFEPTITVLEDPLINVSGPYYLKGGIEVINEEGKAYEVRNRQALCRCGNSYNKPFCDGTHASSHFDDGELASRKLIK